MCVRACARNRAGFSRTDSVRVCSTVDTGHLDLNKMSGGVDSLSEFSPATPVACK